MKRLIDVDDDLLADARRILGTKTIKDTVNESLRMASTRRRAELREALRAFGELAQDIPFRDREEAW